MQQFYNSNYMQYFSEGIIFWGAGGKKFNNSVIVIIFSGKSHIRQGCQKWSAESQFFIELGENLLKTYKYIIGLLMKIDLDLQLSMLTFGLTIV